ncbi:MAG: hypothetical protein WAO98_04480 [Alphaproteobacteria bacterium]
MSADRFQMDYESLGLDREALYARIHNLVLHTRLDSAAALYYSKSAADNHVLHYQKYLDELKQKLPAPSFARLSDDKFFLSTRLKTFIQKATDLNSPEVTWHSKKITDLNIEDLKTLFETRGVGRVAQFEVVALVAIVRELFGAPHEPGLDASFQKEPRASGSKTNSDAITFAYQHLGLDQVKFYERVDELAAAHAIASVGARIRGDRKAIDEVVVRFSQIPFEELQGLVGTVPLTAEKIVQKAPLFSDALLELVANGDYASIRDVFSKNFLDLNKADYKIVMNTPTVAWRAVAEMLAARALFEMNVTSAVDETFERAKILTEVERRLPDSSFREALRGLFTQFPTSNL